MNKELSGVVAFIALISESDIDKNPEGGRHNGR